MNMRLGVLALLGFMMMAGALLASDTADSLYKSKCQFCHGPAGKGTPVGLKLGVKDFRSPEVAKRSDAELARITKEGKAKMPQFEGKLTDDQIRELITFIRKMK